MLKVCEGPRVRPGGFIIGPSPIRIGTLAILQCQRNFVFKSEDGGASRTVDVVCVNTRAAPEFVEKGRATLKQCVEGASLGIPLPRS
jgi:hypothetical protein